MQGYSFNCHRYSVVRNLFGMLFIGFLGLPCQSVFAQIMIPQNAWEMKFYIDQMNKEKEDQRQVIISQSKAAASQAEVQFEQCRDQIASLETKLQFAVPECELRQAELKKLDAQVKEAQTHRQKLEESTLAKLAPQSSYQSALLRFQQSENECTQRAQELVGTGISSGVPSSVRVKLRGAELAKIEADPQWNTLANDYEIAKTRLSIARKETLRSVPELQIVDETIARLVEQRRVSKDRVAKLETTVRTLKRDIKQLSGQAAASQRIGIAAKRQVATVGGN